MTRNGLEFTFFPSLEIYVRVSFASHSRSRSRRVRFGNFVCFIFSHAVGKCSKKFTCSIAIMENASWQRVERLNTAIRKAQISKSRVYKFIHKLKAYPACQTMQCKYYIRSYIRAREIALMLLRKGDPAYAQLKYIYI